MHTVAFIIAGVFAVGVVAALLAHFGWSISTQHHDHGAAASGPLSRRRIGSRRRPAAHAGPINPEAIPSESIAGQPSDLSVGIPPEAK